MINVSWIKCVKDSWCSFRNVDLEDEHFDDMEGVYVIWQGNGPVVRIGQGVIRDRIASHRDDDEINVYKNLYVVWARVEKKYRDGVERYLGDRLEPEVSSTFPDIEPIKANLPWGWI